MCGTASGSGVYSGSNTAIGTGSPSNRRLILMGAGSSIGGVSGSSGGGIVVGAPASTTIVGSGGVGSINIGAASSSIAAAGSGGSSVNTGGLGGTAVTQLQQLQTQSQTQSITSGGPDLVRRSRSQGGKKLQKCLSTASYGEELSISRPQMSSLPYNLLSTRQYCSFGSTTSLTTLNLRFTRIHTLFCSHFTFQLIILSPFIFFKMLPK